MVLIKTIYENILINYHVHSDFFTDKILCFITFSTSYNNHKPPDPITYVYKIVKFDFQAYA